MTLVPLLTKLSHMLDGALKYQTFEKADAVKNLYDYKTKRATYYLTAVEAALAELGQAARAEPFLLPKIAELQKAASRQQYGQMKKIVEQLQQHAPHATHPPPFITITLPRLPAEIRDEIHADITELGKCFEAQCYRSSIVLCGRILETTLHRKYYDVIGKDILETQPGIGLGTMVAKLKEKNVHFDPAITQQIHLINQMRISSVHKKSDAFVPTKAQAHATILYTLDIVDKIFRH